MCGISGIINQNNLDVSKDEIKSINDLIAHRGPDDEGFYFGKGFAFGHRRLSILDLSSAGHQPMAYMDKYVITYNGEIYNYLEIRKELEEDGYRFHSHTDTEVILASYDKWKEGCVQRFNGMWAFAIYDAERNIIFCSRDRFGIKPFYYTEVDRKFVFGSEIKQLLEYYSENFVNKDILVDYLVTGFLDYSDETFFENIYKLDPSHNLIYDLHTHRYSMERYFDITKDEKIARLDEDEDEAVNAYQKVFSEAIELRLRSDVKVGTCLSGGLDSSSVAATASALYHQQSGENFTAIHAKSIEKATDESGYAEDVAEFCNLDLHIVEPGVEDFQKKIDEVIYAQEEPFGGPSIFMQYFVMKKARELGCKVMLDGQGGDETLLGYEKYYPSAYWYIFKHDGLLATLWEVFLSYRNNKKMSPKWIMIYFIGSFFSGLRIFRYKRAASFLKKDYLKKDFDFVEILSRKYSDVFELQKYEINSTNLPVLLRYEDKNSMRCSVETRLPFIDYRALETALNIDVKQKIHGGWTKYILRKVIDGKLPDNVVWRKSKLGFNAPDSTWMCSYEEKMIKEIQHSNILHHLCDMNALLSQYKSLNIRLKWRIYNIAKWEEVYDVKIR